MTLATILKGSLDDLHPELNCRQGLREPWVVRVLGLLE